MAERIGALLLCVVLVVMGGLAWRIQMIPELVPDAARLASLPKQIGLWRAVDIPMDEAVEAELRADLNIQRAYRLPTGELVWLYIGYYGTARGGRPEHTPRSCYVSADWGIESADIVDLSARSESLRVNEYVIERQGETRLVQFWYRSHRQTGLVGGLDQGIDRFLGRLLEGRADGALIRVSTPVARDTIDSTRSRVMSFAADVDTALAERWPEERPVGALAALADSR